MKINKKYLNIPLIFLLIIVVLYMLNINSRLDILEVISGTDKIGIVPLRYNEKENRYEKGEERLITDKKIVYKIINTINNGKINKQVKLDRLPAEYELYFYKKNQITKVFYWINCPKYNLNIEGIQGEITVSTKLDKIIESIINQH